MAQRLAMTLTPDGVTAQCQWIYSIEGRPSTRTVLSIEPTLSNLDNMAVEPGAPGYVGSAVCLIQAVPGVIAAPPGIKATDIPSVHWRKDLRIPRLDDR